MLRVISVIPIVLAVASGTALAQKKSSGRTLYLEKCAPCHGDEGGGDGPGAKTMLPRPRVFADNSDFKFRSTASGNLPTDADLMKVITEGIYGTAMPAFGHLPEADRRALVEQVKAFNPEFKDKENVGETLQIPSPPSITDELIAKGKKIYTDMKCWECHGNEGRGDGPTWADKKDSRGDPIVPADLQRGHQLRCGDSIECLFKTTLTGLSGTPMPNYDLPPEDRWALSAWLKSIQQPKKERQDQIVVAKLLPELPKAADDPAWDKLPQAMFFTSAQVVQKPRLFWPAVTELFVRAAYNDEEIAILIEWHDRDQSKGKNAAEYPAASDPITDVFVGTDHPDQLAVQFPSGLGLAEERPYFMWGDPKHAVNLWWWGSHLSGLDLGGIRERNAFGKPDSISDQDADSQQLTASVTYKDGRYRMLVKRSLRTANEMDVQFEAGRFTPIAFHIWQGSQGESGMRRAITSWYAIVLEPPTPITAYVYPAIAGLITLLALGFLVVRVRATPAPLPKSKELGTLGAAEPVLPVLPDVPADQRIGLVGVLTVVIGLPVFIWVVIVGIGAIINKRAESEKDTMARGRDAEVQKLREKQVEEIHLYEWVDEKKGTAKIPVERAMELVIEDARQGKESLVPAVGAHDKPTLPAKYGRDEVKPGAAPNESSAPGMPPAPPTGDPNAAPVQPGELPPPTEPGAEGQTPAEGATTPAPAGAAIPPGKAGQGEATPAGKASQGETTPAGKAAAPAGKGAAPAGKGAAPAGKGAAPAGKGAAPAGKAGKAGASKAGAGKAGAGKAAAPAGKAGQDETPAGKAGPDSPAGKSP